MAPRRHVRASGCVDENVLSETGSGAACGAPRSRFLLCMFRPYVLEGGGGHSHGYALAVVHSVIRVWGRVTPGRPARLVAWAVAAGRARVPPKRVLKRQIQATNDTKQGLAPLGFRRRISLRLSLRAARWSRAKRSRRASSLSGGLMIHVRDIHPTPAHAHAEHLADGREGEHARPAHPPLPHQPLPHRLPLLPHRSRHMGRLLVR